MPSASSGRLVTCTLPVTTCTAGKLPTFTVPLTAWKDYRRCRPDASGLREVYFRYDDELEYWAKANNFATEIQRFSGTKVYDFPVVLSARFDERGILTGIRIVSDPRDTSNKSDSLKHSFTAGILHQSTKQSKVEFRSLDSGRASPSGWPLASQNTIAARAVATRADFAKCALPWPETGDAP